jgi:hypothetical protein
MITKIKAPITVISVYNHKNKVFYPAKIFWEGRGQKISKIGYHHSYYTGKNLVHTYSVLSQNQYFKINFNTKNLSWEVEEINDGIS